ncbi:MAG TPA: hypothetical protein VGD43_11650 [Micromonospora sp.]
MLDSCDLPELTAYGLAWQPATGEIYVQQAEAKILRLDPATCGVLGEVSYRAVADSWPFRSIDVDNDGRTWGMARTNATVIEPAMPAPADQPWLDLSTSGGTLQPGESTEVQVTVDMSGLAPGQARHAQLLVTSDTGRNHGVRQIPVSAAVPRYDVAVNTGGSRVVAEDGTDWQADLPYRASRGFGWTGRTTPVADRSVEDPLAADAREGSLGYEFHDLPDGTYEVTLVFRDVDPADRLFDVTAQGATVLAGYRPTAGRTDVRRVRVEVSGGTLRLALVNHGQAAPLLNAIRVTDRPDL